MGELPQATNGALRGIRLAAKAVATSHPHGNDRPNPILLECMLSQTIAFDLSIGRQMSLNKARSPTERFCALCDLLDVARAMAPRDPAACERRRRALAARERDREQLRAHFRRLLAAGRKSQAVPPVVQDPLDTA